MNAPETLSIIDLMQGIGKRARAAAHGLGLASSEQKNQALLAMAEALYDSNAMLLEANAQDMEVAEKAGLAGSFLDRLKLDTGRINAIGEGLEAIAALPDPVGRVMESWERPNGLRMERVRTPLGVIGVIFESRPNVTADAGGLCLKAGNAAILRSGSDAMRSATAIHDCMVAGLKAAKLSPHAIQLVPVKDRAAVGEMLKGLDGNLDVIVPRGGKSLVGRVQEEARVPVFAHLEGVVHLYVHAAADQDKARAIVKNSKMRRTGICGAAETLLIDVAIAETMAPELITLLLDEGCAVRGDAAICAVDSRVTPAAREDWSTEYLDAVISAKLVDGLDAAIAHVEQFGSHHTDCIITEDEEAAAKFMREVDSAIVLHNASTQFADGGEFGFGAEIGIATGRMHARGPVGVEQLTSFKYKVYGAGQIRS